MALQLTITNPVNGATYTNAYGRIDNAEVLFGAEITSINLNWYASSDAANQSLQPVRNDPTQIPSALITAADPTFVQGLQTALTNNQIVTPQDALKTALYLLLQGLSRYAGAVSV